MSSRSVSQPNGALMRWRTCSHIVSVTPMTAMVHTCCTTMNSREKYIFEWRRKVPRTTSMGCADEMTMAGAKPAAMPNSRVKPTMAESACGRNRSAVCMMSMSPLAKLPSHELTLWLFTNQLTYGSAICTNSNAIRSDSRQSMTLSPMSLSITALRCDPSRRRMAISRIRKVLWAIVRFT